MRKRLAGSAVAGVAVLVLSSGITRADPRGRREKQILRGRTSQEFGGGRGSRRITLGNIPSMKWRGP